VAQEYLPNIDGEFTCGLFRSNSGVIRTIIFRRELTAGYSGFGEVIRNNDITDLLLNIAEKLDLRGSINIQLRLRNEQPVVFEINPRFSSTVLFRSLFGFNDVIWSIQDILGISLNAYSPSNKYRFFYKGFSEYID